jgi:hypothetical protein
VFDLFGNVQNELTSVTVVAGTVGLKNPLAFELSAFVTLVLVALPMSVPSSVEPALTTNDTSVAGAKNAYDTLLTHAFDGIATVIDFVDEEDNVT